MNLPAPMPVYDMRNEGETRAALAREDARNRKKDENVEIGSAMLVLTSPDGTRFSVTVSDAGVISASAL